MVNTSLYNLFFNTGSKVMKGGAFSPSNTIKLIQEKKTFLIMIFANLILQLGITYYILVNTDIQVLKERKRNSIFKRNFIGLLPLFILVILMNLPMPSWARFIVFSFFSAYMGLILNSWEKIYGLEMLKAIIFSVVGIFISMMVFAVGLLSFGIKLGSTFGIFLIVALLLFIISRIIFFFAGTYSLYAKMFAIFGIALFSIYILYDTQQVLSRNYDGDFVTASLDYYLDFINLVGNFLSFNSN